MAGGFPAGPARVQILYVKRGRAALCQRRPFQRLHGSQAAPGGSTGQGPARSCSGTASGSLKTGKLAQTQRRTGQRYAACATALKAIRWNPANSLFALQHGRDQLSYSIPKCIPTRTMPSCLPKSSSASARAMILAGTILLLRPAQRAEKHWLRIRRRRQPAGRCADVKPILAFPSTIWPNDLVFYTATNIRKILTTAARLFAFHGVPEPGPCPRKDSL